jgi:gamma-glutamylcyclotransferase (GGCT)/AIG2-like uncharacterized protein YtfP
VISSEPNHLFVYGTLRPGLAPPVIADVVNKLRVAGPATIPGRLYSLGAYPGCVLDDARGRLVHGVLLEIEDPTVLQRLDWYEGYAAHDERGSLFTRTTCRATTPDGSQVFSWIYVYNRDVSRARQIESGRFDSQTSADRA